MSRWLLLVVCSWWSFDGGGWLRLFICCRVCFVLRCLLFVLAVDCYVLFVVCCPWFVDVVVRRCCLLVGCDVCLLLVIYCLLIGGC